MNNIADRIRELRSSISQKSFAEKIGVNPNTLRAYEKGRASPPSDVITSICSKFDVSYKWLLTGEGSMRPKEAGADAPGATGASGRMDCAALEIELRKEREAIRELVSEIRQLNAENRKLWKENSDLRVALERARAGNPNEVRPMTPIELTPDL